MIKLSKGVILMLFSAGIIILAGCSGPSSATTQPVVKPPVQTTDQQSLQQPVQQNTSAPTQSNSQVGGQSTNQVAVNQTTATISVPVKTTTKTPPVLSNRVDVIYFHTKLRCVTCLCFEKQVTNLINKYYQSDIDSGRLIYRVLNVQEQQNVALAKKYVAVGSQLFINSVINDFDNIEDIQDIWSWDCVNNPSRFDVKIKSVIDAYLKGKP
jgi:hypothetical protein